MNTDAAARAVDDAVRAVDGVTEVYAARPLVARVVRTVVASDAPLSVVTATADGAEATVSVGIVDLDAARDTAVRVAAAARAALGAPRAPVTVRVSRILAASSGAPGELTVRSG